MVGYIRDCMIYNNADLYFKKSWKNHWYGIPDAWKALYDEKGINLLHLMGQYVN